MEQTKITEQLYTTPALIAQDKFLDQEISRVRQELGPLQKLVPANCDVDWSGVLNAVRRAAPAGVCVTELSGDNRSERVSLKGLALSGEAAQSFARGLDGSKPFTSVAMTRIDCEAAGRQEPRGIPDRLLHEISERRELTVPADRTIMAKGSKRNAISIALIVIGAAAMYNWILSPQVGYLRAVQRYQPVVDEMAEETGRIGGTLDAKRQQLRTLQQELAEARGSLFTREEARDVPGQPAILCRADRLQSGRGGLHIR